MSDVIKIDSLSELHRLMGLGAPGHPLVSVIDLARTQCPIDAVNTRIVPNFYSITLKTKAVSLMRYGRGYYDFADGALVAMEPGQAIEVEEAHQYGDLEGWALYFHPDLLAQHPLQRDIKKFGFFSYAVSEALHLSVEEQEMLTAITVKISDEYKQNIDDFSRDIVLANIALMMGYINRYFNRQFITRKHQNQEIVDKVSDLLEVYYTSDKATEMGLPSVQHIAEQLHLSPNYLSDLLRKETGSSTQDLIHEHIIERAKYKLLNSNDSVSRISISLGFEYPQYFSRMFKRRTGLAPQEFRKSEPPLLS